MKKVFPLQYSLLWHHHIGAPYEIDFCFRPGKTISRDELVRENVINILNFQSVAILPL